jgi:hypothetical protein
LVSIVVILSILIFVVICAFSKRDDEEKKKSTKGEVEQEIIVGASSWCEKKEIDLSQNFNIRTIVQKLCQNTQL